MSQRKKNTKLQTTERCSMVTIVTHTSLGSESVHTPDVFHVLPNLMLTSTIQVGTIFPALQKRKLRLREVVFQVVAEADLQARNFWSKSFITPYHTTSLIQREKVEGKRRRDYVYNLLKSYYRCFLFYKIIIIMQHTELITLCWHHINPP